MKLNASIAAKDSSLEVQNQGNLDWNEIKITLRSRGDVHTFQFVAGEIKAQQVAIFAFQDFKDFFGNRYCPPAHKNIQVWIDCSTSQGSGIWVGETDEDSQVRN
jgi:hypothetical protein